MSALNKFSKSTDVGHKTAHTLHAINHMTSVDTATIDLQILEEALRWLASFSTGR